MRRRLTAAITLTLVVGCSASGGTGAGGGEGGAGAGTGTGGSGGSLNVDGGGATGGSGGIITDGGSNLPAVGHLQGRVTAPEGTIPIAGALVFLTTGSVGPIPDQTHCDRCVELDSSTPYTFSGPDGSFNLGAPAVGNFSLVVQKGQFRRIRPVTVVEGDQPVPADFTRMPSRTDDTAGDHIPRMAVVTGAWDDVGVSLAKLGLGTLKAGLFNRPTVDLHSFDLYGGLGQPSGVQLLRDPNLLSQYHILFMPCTGSTDQPLCDDFTELTEPAVRANLDTFVRSGGKLYVSDWSYEYVRQPFPGYVTFQGEGPDIGSACTLAEWNAPATAADPGLGAWLGAQGLIPFDVEANYIHIERVNPTPGLDADGNPTTITPKVWVEAQGRPATVSFEHQCGRVLYSTYHTEADQGSFTDLMPQEKALMYVLLEVGVCVGPGIVR